MQTIIAGGAGFIGNKAAMRTQPFHVLAHGFRNQAVHNSGRKPASQVPGLALPYPWIEKNRGLFWKQLNPSLV